MSGRTRTAVVAAAMMYLAGSGISAPAADAASRLHREVLTLSAPTTITPAESSVLAGRLIDRASGRPIPGARISFLYALPGAKQWKSAGTALTNGQGYYRSQFTTPTSVYFSTYFAGNRARRDASSPARYIAMPANGTAGWTDSDDCHYTVTGGRWLGDFCAAYQTDASGNPIKTVYNIYTYVNGGTSHVGPLKYQLNTAYPNWITWRVPSDPEYNTVLWSAVPRNDIQAEPELYVDLGGTWQWTTVSQLQTLIQQLEQEIAAAQGTIPSGDVITVGGASETPQGFTDLANGIDRLGGNAELGETFSRIYSLGVSDPVTMGVCGEYDYTCVPLGY